MGMSMGSPGVYQLALLSIGAALSQQQQTPIVGLKGLRSVTLEADFSGGTGGSTVTAVVRTRLGSAGLWREIARFDFTAAEAKGGTVETGQASIATLGALSANTVRQGFLGTDLDCLVSSSGTYTGSQLSIRAAVR